MVTKKKLLPTKFFNVRYLHCLSCGEYFSVPAKYFNEMRKAGRVICGFCKVKDPVEVSPEEWEALYQAKIRKVKRGPTLTIEKLDEFTYSVPSKTVAGKFYTVKVMPGDIWTCECVGYEMACVMRGTDCIHIKKVKEAQSISRPSTETCAPHVLQI